MIYHFTPLSGVYLIEPERHEDSRGWFARSWCAREFAGHGLNPALAQCSISHNARRGTLRGMHYQVPPHAEAKLVRCTRGSIFDVLVDLREESETFRKWHGEVLSADNHRMLYVPERCAHGFLTLEDDTEVFYQMTEFFHPECARTIPWDNAEIGIDWPIQPVVLSGRDANAGRS